MELALSTTATATLGNEQALVHAVREGDDRAFEQLYALYRGRVAAFIFSKVRDHGRAEDISQEVFMSALRQLRGGEQEISFKPWIFAIAKNACIDEFRRTGRGREVCIEADEDFPADHSASLSIVPSPPAAIESKQRLEDLRGAFGGLSESHHRLLMMREFEGRSYDEIGDRLGMTRQMVQSGLFRARRKLGEEYDELASGRRCEQVQTVIETAGALRLKALGIKERRRLTQHLSHCQACRHQARIAGVDENLLKPRSIAAKIAALLPFGGLWRWPWRRGGSGAGRAHAGTSHTAASGALGGAAQAAGTAGSSISIGQAAAAAALAIAGAGGGIAIVESSHHPAHQPSPVTRPAPATHHSAPTPPAGHPGGAAAAARSAAAAARGARATATGSVARQRTLGTRLSPRHHGAKAPTSPTRGQTTPTRGSGSGSTRPTSTTTPASGGSQARNLLNTTINQTGRTVGKVTTPVNKVTDPITKAVDPVTKAIIPIVNPIKKAVDPIVDPVKKAITPVTDPVNKVAAPVLSSPPVKKVIGTVQQILPPGPSGSPATGSSGGSASPGGSQGPVNTIKNVISGL